MKLRLQSFSQALVICATLMLNGCVGFNTTLFTTKSNAGLDLDAKPPTAEINISRKEGVVEPSFEGGKTPPVMASFSAKTGSTGMSRFFFGVNQTFAGGDAALTMAKLYDRTNDFSDIEAADDARRQELRSLFDSGVPLSEPPKGNEKKGFLGLRKVLFGLPEPGEVRPFFFGTDTQLGVKVAWNGVGGPYPDNVKIGFNRKEMAVAPVTISDQNVVRIPSFLATVDSDVRGSSISSTNQLRGKLGVGWMQYFATGESASSLAREYGVRRAMLERADPKAMSAQDKRFRNFKSERDKQKELLDQIKKAFDAGNDDRKNEITAQGKAVFDLPDDTTSKNFLRRLALEVDGKPANTTKFNALLEKINL